VPPGTYLILITVNPAFKAARGEACPHKDSAGLCHQLPESNYDDNVGEATVVITGHPGKTGVGPATKDGAPHDSDIHDDLGNPID